MFQPPNVRFHRLIPGIPTPHRADRSANGTLPTRASRYCDAVTSAAAFGWHVHVPMDFLLFWDGEEVFWRYGDIDMPLPLRAAQFPYFASTFDKIAPEEAKGCSPPFLTALPESGLVQIWTGLIARTSPGWSLLIRSPANLPPIGGISLYEGMVETDRWFAPLFVNVRLTRTDTPIELGTDMALAQLQPIPRAAYADETLDRFTVSDRLEDDDWSDYIESTVRPNLDPDHKQGSYAIEARKRRRAECPFTGVRKSRVHRDES